MHANKRIRYQSKLIYSYEDGVPTVHSEINACTQWHQPGDSSASVSSLPVTQFPPNLAAPILPYGSTYSLTFFNPN